MDIALASAAELLPCDEALQEGATLPVETGVTGVTGVTGGAIAPHSSSSSRGQSRRAAAAVDKQQEEEQGQRKHQREAGAHEQQQEQGKSQQQQVPLFNVRASELWVLKACQTSGGLRDKPGKAADYYHTCYCLSGLAAAQHLPGGCVLGGEENVLQRTDPLINVVVEKLEAARQYFGDRR